MIKPLKVEELKDKSVAELTTMLSDSLRRKFKQKLLKSSGEIDKTHFIRIIRRNIARIETLLSQKLRHKND